MNEPVAVTDATLARARHDPEFKQRLLTVSLERLLAELHRLQRASAQSSPAGASQMREGASLAVKLADLIYAIDEKRRQLADSHR
jgi:hypothetical protein